MSTRILQLTEFLQQSPSDNFLIHALALEYAKVEDFEQAKFYFEKNIALDNKYVATYYHLGKLYEKNGQEQEAINIYHAGMQVAQEVGDKHAYSELRSVYEELTF
jgi:tetratricopeptide (TPR) repeat protein